MSKELKRLADIARQYRSGLAMERAINVAIKSDKPGRGNLISGVRFGRGGLYSYSTAMALDKAGYKSITDFWTECQLVPAKDPDKAKQK